MRIACIPSIAARLVPFALEVINEEFPRIEIQLFDGCREYGDVIQMVRKGVADLGISHTVAENDLSVLPYVYDTLVAGIPDRMPVSNPLKWSDLEDLAFILQAKPSGEWILEQLRIRGFQQRPAYYMEYEGAILSMVSRGLGFTILPRLAISSEIHGVKFVELPYMIDRRLSIITRASQAGIVGTVASVLRDQRVIMRSDAFRTGALRINF